MGDGRRAVRAREPAFPHGGPGSVVTVGTFDGVHRGHQAVLRALRARADTLGARSVLITFRPHPLRIVRPVDAPPLLTTFEEKKEALAPSGVDYAVFLPFTPGLASFSPRDFVEEILIRQARMVDLVIGYDHGLGRGRSGDTEALQALGHELGFGVTVVDAVDLDDAPVSSTRIREALMAGDVVDAATGLGRPYSLRGRVVHGDGRGRSLGFPTANLQVDDPMKLVPRDGIYAVRAHVRSTARRPDVPRGPHTGAMHIGPRPTFEGAAPTVEVHLLDFDDADLQGATIDVDFCARLRGIEAFDSADALVAAMHRDAAATRALFARSAGACPPCEDVLH